VGLVFGENTWEYPLWVYAQKAGLKDIRIEHVNVDNASASVAYPRGSFDPCMLIYDGATAEAVRVVQGKPFFRTIKSEMSAFIRFDHMPTDFQAEALRQIKGK
jgi:hypothetical protein